MLKAFVGIASDQGLTVLHPEHDETLSFINRSVQARTDRIGFWAVLDDTEARCVNALVVGGRSREALRLLSYWAKEMGSILPNDLHGESSQGTA